MVHVFHLTTQSLCFGNHLKVNILSGFAGNPKESESCDTQCKTQSSVRLMMATSSTNTAKSSDGNSWASVAWNASYKEGGRERASLLGAPTQRVLEDLVTVGVVLVDNLDEPY